jgi:hypothetical protein
MLTKWQLAGPLLIAIGVGLALGPMMIGRRENFPVPPGAFIAGIVIAAIGAILTWKTK